MKKILMLFAISIVLFCSSCNENDNSIAMIKNSELSVYGTCFAVGIPGKPIDTIVTSYNVIALPNGAVPKTAEIRMNEIEENLTANVTFYDEARNIAILKLSKKTDKLKPLIIQNKVDNNEIIFARGYNGTGNIMSDFEEFNTTDIVRYSGNISAVDESNVLVYRYSSEFNRALSGAPAVDEKGNVIGMCSYSLNNMNTYSQYVLSSDEIMKILEFQDIEFMTYDEAKYKRIIICTIILGVMLICAMIVLMLHITNKKENNHKNKDRYINVISGTLIGTGKKIESDISIGRDAVRCDIVYPPEEPGVSAVHCSIRCVENKYYIVDNFSKYGTFLEDGTRILSTEPYQIGDGRTIFYIASPQNKIEISDIKEM